jgi:hypothetical protein
VLGEIATFFELGDDPQFVGRAATLVRDEPAPRFDRLDRAEQDELREACRAGQLLLGRAVS